MTMPHFQRGFVVLYLTVLVLGATLAVAGSMYALAFSNQKIVRNSIWSAQSDYAAESGIEDAVYRIKNFLPYPSTYALAVGPSQTTVSVVAVGPTKTIESDGQQQNRIRKRQAVVAVSSENVSFHYGVQVGSLGLSMGNGSSIIGNVFSNGTIQGGGGSTITGTAQVAGNSGISNITVDGDAYADHFSSCSVGGTAYYVSTVTSCPAHATQHISAQLQPQDFPITSAQINGWENDAVLGGTLQGYALGNGDSGTLGPKKISGNITLGNTATLTLTGTVWVTGTVVFGNNAALKLDQSYGAQSGILVVDGSVTIGNGVIVQGSGQPGSNILVLSTYGSGVALTIGTSAQAAIFYAPNGTITIGNGLDAQEITGKGLTIGNNSTLTYQSGLINTNFTSGPGGSFEVMGWKEIQ